MPHYRITCTVLRGTKRNCIEVQKTYTCLAENQLGVVKWLNSHCDNMPIIQKLIKIHLIELKPDSPITMTNLSAMAGFIWS